MEGKSYPCKGHSLQGKLKKIVEDKISFQEYCHKGFWQLSLSIELWRNTGKALVGQAIHSLSLKGVLSSSRNPVMQIHHLYWMVILKSKFQFYVFICNAISSSKILFWANQKRRCTMVSICQILSNGYTWKTAHRQIAANKSNKTIN